MKDIKIYPSSWYYNACVHGFLETLAWGLGGEGSCAEEGSRVIQEKILQDDGSAIITGCLAVAIFGDESVFMPEDYHCRPAPRGLEKLKRLARWWAERSWNEGFVGKRHRGDVLGPLERLNAVCSRLFSRNCPYENLVQPKWNKIEFLNNWFERNCSSTVSAVNCSFCGEPFFPDPDPAARVYDLYFTRPMSKNLGNSPDGFPNMFWDGKPNLPVCRTCRSYFLHFHFVYKNRFFVNTGSFLSNWYLNRLISGRLEGDISHNRVAFLDALKYDSQLRRGISGWGLQNIEMVLFEEGDVLYYPVSARLAKLLLVPQISSLLGKIVKISGQSIVWDCILKERFDYLPIVIYKSLRVFLAGSNHGDDAEIINKNLKDTEAILYTIELYNEIKKNLSTKKGGFGLGYLNVRGLKNVASSAPLLNDNMVFRLLELTRLNKKSDVYHLLLRAYVAAGVAFPDVLIDLFEIRDDELFKTGVYAFISGLSPGTKEKTE